MTLSKLQEGIFYKDSTMNSLSTTDGIIFDCDGVLIDVTKSYDLAITQTTKYILENLADIKDSIPIDSKIIEGFKATGGFNDEVDLTYAAIISIVAAKKLEKNQHDFIFDVIKNCDSSGIISAQKFIENQTQIDEIKNKLSYPGTIHTNPLYKIFDQLFYGPQLYEKLFNVKSEFNEPGLVENDKVLLNDSLISNLQKKYDSKMSLVTGRGKESVRFSLKEMLEKFDLKNSSFLEDEPRDLAKPNPIPLTRAISGMNCKSVIYVGDSMEDLIMSKKATEQGHNIIFCGIIGTSKNPLQKLDLFEKNGARLVLDSIDLLPKVINLE